MPKIGGTESKCAGQSCTAPAHGGLLGWYRNMVLQFWSYFCGSQTPSHRLGVLVLPRQGEVMGSTVPFAWCWCHQSPQTTSYIPTCPSAHFLHFPKVGHCFGIRKYWFRLCGVQIGLDENGYRLYWVQALSCIQLSLVDRSSGWFNDLPLNFIKYLLINLFHRKKHFLVFECMQQ